MPPVVARAVDKELARVAYYVPTKQEDFDCTFKCPWGQPSRYEPRTVCGRHGGIRARPTRGNQRHRRIKGCIVAPPISR
ncbi:MAG: hypothetical protein ACYC0B_09025 [Gemmatimonadaceae bacterium]